MDGLKRLKNEEQIVSKLAEIEKLIMELMFLRIRVQIGNSKLDHLASRLLKDIKTYVCSKNDYLPSAAMTEKQMFEYLDSLLRNLNNLCLTKCCAKLILPLMSDYRILLEVCRHLRDFSELKIKGCIWNKKIEYVSPQFKHTADRVRQFCLDLWTNEKCKEKEEEVLMVVEDKEDDSDEEDVGAGAGDNDENYSCKFASLLFEIIPVELEVLYNCCTKLKDSTSTEVKWFVKQLLETTPQILRRYLILLKGRMAGAVSVNAPIQSINVMMEFLVIFFTDISRCLIYCDKLNDILERTVVLTREMSILVRKLEESSSNEANFAAPYFLQQIEQIKGDLKIHLKAPDSYSSQLCFPMGAGILFMDLLLRHLNNLFNSNATTVALILKQEIGIVKEDLEFLRSFFRKVRQTMDDNRSLKGLWGRALDVAHEVQHVINSILVRDNALSHLIFSLPSVIDKIKLIVVEVKVTSLLLEDTAKIGDPLDAKSSNEPMEPSSTSVVEVTVGLEKETHSIIHEQIIKGPKALDVISIVGLPGLGKTTLANKVYKNTLVARHFNVRAWCTVSKKYNKSKLLHDIFNQVTGSKDKPWEGHNDIADKLRRELRKKRYLIVLDDLWDIASWEELTAGFPDVMNGSRIILTSRSAEVASKVKCHTSPLNLRLLTPEESWELFEKKVFGEEKCPGELLDVGQKIVEKCQGLPLVVVLIAGVIRRKEEKEDSWLEILGNLNYFVFKDEEQMMKVMQMSYDHLPDNVKPCLLYFAGSQNNKRTPESELIRLLMAEGFVDDIPSKSLEEVTQTYLDALISSSLVMVFEKEAVFSRIVRVCSVHDIVHEFCSITAKKERFFHFISSGTPVHNSDFMHRCLTIQSMNDHQLDHNHCIDFLDFENEKSSRKHVISLKVSGFLDPFSLGRITRLRLLRVLQLGDVLLGDSSVNEIGYLVHLRLLKIWTEVKSLPWSWSNLRNLETLEVKSESNLVILPRIWKLSKLKHVSITKSCTFFSKDMHEPAVSEEKSKLEDLRTLSHVGIPYSEDTTDVLQRFPNLQHFECTFVQLSDSPKNCNWFPKLDVLTKLESLLFVVYSEFSWQNLFIALQGEYIIMIDVSPPLEYHFPTSLKELRLYYFPVTPVLLSAIAALPELEILKFTCSYFVENKWIPGDDRFENLKILSLDAVRFSEWQVKDDTFPNLEELILEGCKNLKEIPSEFGDIISLKSIHLTHMMSDFVDSAMKLKDDVNEFAGYDRLDVTSVYSH